MKTKIFWIGIIILTLGVILFVYGYSDIRTIGGYWNIYEQRYQIAQILESVGIGLIFLGIVITAYGILAKTKQ